jgi:hypothetical protein
MLLHQQTEDPNICGVGVRTLAGGSLEHLILQQPFKTAVTHPHIFHYQPDVTRM